MRDGDKVISSAHVRASSSELDLGNTFMPEG